MKRQATAPRRLGIFGGTFDPPHTGHLALAECAREQLGLDRVLFVPAARPPHKRGAKRSSAAHRVAMTRAAVRGNPAFAVSTIETRRRGPSWTVDTVRALAAEHAGEELWLLMGADSYAAFGTWREPAEIARHARLAVALRPGTRAPKRPRGVARDRVTFLENPELEISSSAVRERARAGRSVRYLVPDAVARHIARHGLYGSAS
ncbi:MAG: nicotinate-nucleotide adenylyltransferase [Candidatus Eisenbacteria bacterium]|uniref:Probable nicotinate-nucleotide adenylyltransferase n=1 Tax=Eiseniibacteriota bacterium TaxID=2212470 RepID=A0A933W2P9_UNCEI|nr:nicotinate-nucleotide adenylyltransferase [Candidatus Eisenbacteria bacterium]